MFIRLNTLCSMMALAAPLFAQPANNNCQGLPTASQLKTHLQNAPGMGGPI